MSNSEPQQPAEITGRVVADFSDYGGMIDAMRARADERRVAITSPGIAELANLPDYYIAKLLSVHPVRRIGMISLGPILSILGVRLLMVEDKNMMERMDRLAIQKFGEPLKPRNEGCVHNGGVITFKFSRRRAVDLVDDASVFVGAQFAHGLVSRAFAALAAELGSTLFRSRHTAGSCGRSRRSSLCDGAM